MDIIGGSCVLITFRSLRANGVLGTNFLSMSRNH